MYIEESKFVLRCMGGFFLKVWFGISLGLYVHSAFFTSRFLNFYFQTFGGWGVLLIEHAKSGRVCLFKSLRRLHFNHAVVVD